MAIIHGRDITLCPSPVPRNCGGDGVDCQLGDAMSEGSLVRKSDTGAADPPNGPEGGAWVSDNVDKFKIAKFIYDR